MKAIPINDEYYSKLKTLQEKAKLSLEHTLRKLIDEALNKWG